MAARQLLIAAALLYNSGCLGDPLRIQEHRLDGKGVPQLHAADGLLHVYALPVGQGDTHVIQCPDGALSIFDMGSSNDPGGRFFDGDDIEDFLIGRFRDIVNVFISHNHFDHYKFLTEVPGMNFLLGLQNIYISCTQADMATRVSDWVNAISGHSKIRLFNGGAGCGPIGGPCDMVDVCPGDPGVVSKVMGANLGQCTSGNPNMDSIMLKLTYGDVSILLSGDFEDATTNWSEDGPQKWMGDFYGPEMVVTVNHIAHHSASSKANKPVWRDALMPKVVYSSGDPWYGYNHPRCAVFDGFIDYVGTLCKPWVTDVESSFYCGARARPELPQLAIVQPDYTCGFSSSVEYRTGNDYAIYTTVPDQITTHQLDFATDGVGLDMFIIRYA